MASGIAITPERLREISERISNGATDVKAILSRLAGDMAPVRAEWVGSAQAQFNVLWDQVQRDASGLQTVLAGIAQLTEQAATPSGESELSMADRTDQAATTSGETEQSIAGTFAEFCVELDKLSELLGPAPSPSSSPSLIVDRATNDNDNDTEVDTILIIEDLAGDEVIEDDAVEDDSDEDDSVEVVDGSVDGWPKTIHGPWARFMTPNAWRDIEAGRN
jgi:WXG100 family type VII secretion target